MALASKGGLGITAQDMEASRLVFVSIKDARPRRKVAVPVPDGMTWQQFLQQVQTKLKIGGIDAIYLASSGERVTSLDVLQDIDELHVVEGQPPVPSTAPATMLTEPVYANGHTADHGNSKPAIMQPAYSAEPHTAMDMTMASTNSERVVDDHPVAAADVAGAGPSSLDDDGHADKYSKKRTFPLRRTLQSMFPSMFPAASLPVTTKDISREPSADGVGPPRPGRRRAGSRGRRSTLMNMRMGLLVCIVVAAMLMVLYMLRRVTLPDIRGR